MFSDLQHSTLPDNSLYHQCNNTRFLLSSAIRGSILLLYLSGVYSSGYDHLLSFLRKEMVRNERVYKTNSNHDPFRRWIELSNPETFDSPIDLKQIAG